jgi:hypothetical protein
VSRLHQPAQQARRADLPSIIGRKRQPARKHENACHVSRPLRRCIVIGRGGEPRSGPGADVKGESGVRTSARARPCEASRCWTGRSSPTRPDRVSGLVPPLRRAYASFRSTQRSDLQSDTMTCAGVGGGMGRTMPHSRNQSHDDGRGPACSASPLPPRDCLRARRCVRNAARRPFPRMRSRYLRMGRDPR